MGKQYQAKLAVYGARTHRYQLLVCACMPLMHASNFLEVYFHIDCYHEDMQLVSGTTINALYVPSIYLAMSLITY